MDDTDSCHLSYGPIGASSSTYPQRTQFTHKMSMLQSQTSIVKTRHTDRQPSSGGSLHPKRRVYSNPPPPTWHPTPSRCYALFAPRLGRWMVPPISLCCFNNRSLCSSACSYMNQKNQISFLFIKGLTTDEQARLFWK